MKDVLVDGLADCLSFLVLRIDSIFNLLDLGIFELIEVVVFVTFRSFFVFGGFSVALLDEKQGFVLAALGHAVLGSDVAGLVHLATDYVLILLVKFFELVVHDLVIG